MKTTRIRRLICRRAELKSQCAAAKSRTAVLDRAIRAIEALPRVCVADQFEAGKKIPGTTLIYVRPGGRNKDGRQMTRVRCLEHCNEYEVVRYDLTSGNTKGCRWTLDPSFVPRNRGKLSRARISPFRDFRVGQTATGIKRFGVKCPHGNEFEVALFRLRNGHTKSCKRNPACILPLTPENQLKERASYSFDLTEEINTAITLFECGAKRTGMNLMSYSLT